ncbi:hypothetical protein [Candidatus Hadarchaeum sp.]
MNIYKGRVIKRAYLGHCLSSMYKSKYGVIFTPGWKETRRFAVT